MCELAAGTSSRNKIFQLFPKDTPEPEVELEVLPGTVHAWSVGPSALKASARQVYEKMLHPSLGGKLTVCGLYGLLVQLDGCWM